MPGMKTEDFSEQMRAKVLAATPVGRPGRTARDIWLAVDMWAQTTIRACCIALMRDGQLQGYQALGIWRFWRAE